MNIFRWVVGVTAVTVLSGALLVSTVGTDALSPPPAGGPGGSIQPAGGTAGARIDPGTPVLVWTPGGLPAGLGEAARKAPATDRVAEVDGDYAWLDAWAPAGGQPSAPRPGMAVPVDIAAIDLADFLAFVASASDRGVLTGLTQDQIVLSKTGAALRGVGPGGWLRFGDTTLMVKGVVDDGAIGGHEGLVIREAGARIRVTQPRYLLVKLRHGIKAGDMESALQAALPDGEPLRVRVPNPGTILREGEVTLTPGALKLVFGEFAAARGPGGALVLDPAWVAANIQEMTLPLVGPTKCHRAIFPQLQAALREIADKGLGDLVRRADFGGCWFPRFLNWDPEAGISHHTWGLAVDFNVNDNLYGTPGRMDPRIVEILERWGFEWGGRWLVPDPMHFEFVRAVPAGD